MLFNHFLAFQPLLISLGVCFRELDLSAILIGLQSTFQPVSQFKLPTTDVLLDSHLSEAVRHVYDLTHVVHHGKTKSPPVQINWLTISYLLHELKLKIDYFAGVE